MRIPKFILSAVILFNFSCSVVFQGQDNEWTTVNITQTRDMSQYTGGGHAWCQNRPFGNFGDIKRGEKKVHDFIWRHWTEKKRGYIKFSCGYTDTSRTIHYFIEPNEKGEWNIARRDIFQNSENEKTITDDVLISIERTEAENNIDWTLISRSKNGEIIERLPIY